MNVLVTGGAASGKSVYAEQVACGLSAMRTYAATMLPVGTEACERIERHRQQRANLGFSTVECARGLVAVLPQEGQASGVVLVEDLGNLVANALFDEAGALLDAKKVLDALEADLVALMEAYEHTVIVGNEVGCASLGCTVEAEGGDSTSVYVHLLGSLACKVAARCNVVVEVVAGIPLAVKGTLL